MAKKSTFYRVGFRSATPNSLGVALLKKIDFLLLTPN